MGKKITVGKYLVELNCLVNGRQTEGTGFIEPQPGARYTLSQFFSVYPDGTIAFDRPELVTAAVRSAIRRAAKGA